MESGRTNFIMGYDPLGWGRRHSWYQEKGHEKGWLWGPPQNREARGGERGRERATGGERKAKGDGDRGGEWGGEMGARGGERGREGGERGREGAVQMRGFGWGQTRRRPLHDTITINYNSYNYSAFTISSGAFNIHLKIFSIQMSFTWPAFLAPLHTAAHKGLRPRGGFSCFGAS